jgi:Ni/Co efflux regulator RcnB
MKSKAMISAFIAVSLLAGGPAFAQNYDHDHGQDRGYSHDRGQDHGNDHGHDGPPAGYGHSAPPSHYDNHADNRERGAGPRHDFYRGRPLPREYRNRNYAVNNWRNHHLHAPPRGYQWFQTGADYVLVAAATGIIAEIVIGR